MKKQNSRSNQKSYERSRRSASLNCIISQPQFGAARIFAYAKAAMAAKATLAQAKDR
jgi:hypothetical protein